MKTLLLCFIHGFKGGDDTFGTFPEHLRNVVQNGLPDLQVREIVYPKFETRGDLAECVSRFRDWLQEQVIDLEVTNATPSPTVDPSVHTILIGHSMGGIVAADTLLSINSDLAIDNSSPTSHTSVNTLMFPYVQGVLAFDTPYLGISPGVVAHGAEGHYNTASSVLTQLSGLSGVIWGGKAADDAEKAGKKKEAVASIQPAPADTSTSPWQKWGKMAMYAGAAGAVAAGGAAAYMKRDQITEGWSWVGSHLEFVGCLMKGEELKKRVASVVRINQETGIGFANLYTRLGKKAMSKEGTFVGTVIGHTRTFCNIPKSEVKKYFREAINDSAQDEAQAHIAMFFPNENPGYYTLLEDAKTLITQWATGQKSVLESEDTRLQKEL